MKLVSLFVFLIMVQQAISQIHWQDVTAGIAPLPPGIKVLYSNDWLDSKLFIGYYAEARVKNRQLDFTIQVLNGKRYTPSQYDSGNDLPFVVVNTTFFNFDKKTEPGGKRWKSWH